MCFDRVRGVSYGLLTNAAEALGWIRLTREAPDFHHLALVGGGTMKLFNLSLRALLLEIALAQWVTYLVTLVPFLKRGVIDVPLIVRSHVVHVLASIGAFFAAYSCAHELARFGLIAQASAETALAIIVGAILFFGRSWYPASQVFHRRLSLARVSNDASHSESSSAYTPKAFIRMPSANE